MITFLVSLLPLAVFAGALGCFRWPPSRPTFEAPERRRTRPVKRAGKW